jgi:hypothetical protein
MYFTWLHTAIRWLCMRNNSYPQPSALPSFLALFLVALYLLLFLFNFFYRNSGEAAVTTLLTFHF